MGFFSGLLTDGMTSRILLHLGLESLTVQRKAPAITTSKAPSQIGAVLERLLCKLNCVGSCSITNLRHFHENRNAQGQAVWDFSGPANRVYCSQTVFFAKPALRVPQLPETYTLR